MVLLASKNWTGLPGGMHFQWLLKKDLRKSLGAKTQGRGES